jgi:hypothetical protein
MDSLQPTFSVARYGEPRIPETAPGPVCRRGSRPRETAVRTVTTDAATQFILLDGVAEAFADVVARVRIAVQGTAGPANTIAAEAVLIGIEGNEGRRRQW